MPTLSRLHTLPPVLWSLNQPVPAYSLAAFRVVFGLCMLWEVYRYLAYDWVARYWIIPQIHFPYEGFHWLAPLPGDGMYYLFYGLGVLALMIALGLFYRFSSLMFFLGFTYIFLLEQTRYLNHFYLIVLLSFLMIFLPAHRVWSWDAYRFSGRWFKRNDPRQIPFWTVALLRFQLGTVYFLGGVAKLNADWLRGEPMRMWLAERTGFPLIGPYFTQEWMVYFFSYSGLMIDLLALPLLLYRKTRLPMFVVLVLFHFTNDQLFSIGIFPWMAIGVTTIFFAPDWPRQVLNSLRNHPLLFVIAMLAGSYLALIVHEEVAFFPMLIGALVGAILANNYCTADRAAWKRSTSQPVSPIISLPRPMPTWGLTLLIVWASIQLAVPLRHYFIPGNVSWTEEGHRFAWHMKLRDKTGQVQFFTKDETTREKQAIDARSLGMTDRQWRKMSTRPYLIHQLAQHLADQNPGLARPGQGIYVLATCSLNGGEPRLLVDPNVDLTQVDFHDWKRNEWILPLDI
ncbi:HTTM domain-containing protein [Tunicatimonas pelagia]|uniref:HTTM domain-containing protein n=1 Tax=Tunicatimonas pelagia TaxID=931531 RepID=UPI002666B7D9|nr:HTTM domain-containing protein [Tunicatimonas pelagia]WKN44234.1 HTTM domain-containing protein [Tunicatimonas pelagia]